MVDIVEVVVVGDVSVVVDVIDIVWGWMLLVVDVLSKLFCSRCFYTLIRVLYSCSWR